MDRPQFHRYSVRQGQTVDPGVTSSNLFCRHDPDQRSIFEIGKHLQTHPLERLHKAVLQRVLGPVFRPELKDKK